MKRIILFDSWRKFPKWFRNFRYPGSCVFLYLISNACIWHLLAFQTAKWVTSYKHGKGPIPCFFWCSYQLSLKKFVDQCIPNTCKMGSQISNKGLKRSPPLDYWVHKQFLLKEFFMRFIINACTWNLQAFWLQNGCWKMGLDRGPYIGCWVLPRL